MYITICACPVSSLSTAIRRIYGNYKKQCHQFVCRILIINYISISPVKRLLGNPCGSFSSFICHLIIPGKKISFYLPSIKIHLIFWFQKRKLFLDSASYSCTFNFKNRKQCYNLFFDFTAPLSSLPLQLTDLDHSMESKLPVMRDKYLIFQAILFQEDDSPDPADGTRSHSHDPEPFHPDIP